MKIKGSVEKIKPLHLIGAFVFALVSCMALRFYHCISYIDATNGFYTKTDFTVVLFYAILIAVSLFILVAGFLSANTGKFGENTIASNKPLGIAGILLSISMLLESVYSTIRGAYTTGPVSSGGFSSSMSNGELPYKLLSLFSFLTCVYFLVFAINCFKNESKMSSKRIFALMPVGWACTKMIPLFVKQISFVRVSDLVLEIVVVSMFIAYTLSFAQCISGIYSEVAQWRLLSVGLVTSLFALVLNIPRFAFTLVGKSEAYITSGYPVSYAELIFGAFVLVVIFSMMRKENNASYETEEIKEIN